VVKPPRTAVETFKALANFFPQYRDPKAFLIVSDDTPNDLLLDLPWDKIFLTGSGQIGKIVMQAAAKYLTPVTLELGGKSPTLVEKTANIDVAARRIAQGKFINAGQTCVAPDYLLVEEPVMEPLMTGLINYIHEFFGADPRQSAEYGRIINLKQFDTLTEYLKDGEIVTGGQVDRNELYIAPTLLKNVSPESPVMQTEIFGPILPILPVKDMDEAIEFVTRRDKPLALTCSRKIEQSSKAFWSAPPPAASVSMTRSTTWRSPTCHSVGWVPAVWASIMASGVSENSPMRARSMTTTAISTRACVIHRSTKRN
jgi:aldehyde dehydrogenase (NAD+)